MFLKHGGCAGQVIINLIKSISNTRLQYPKLTKYYLRYFLNLIINLTVTVYA